MAGVDILNLAVALERVGGDRELLEEVATVFLSTAPDLIRQIREAVASRDAAKLQRAAHTLKGSLGNFAAQAACDAALRLEERGRSGNLDGVGEALARLEEEMRRLLPILASLGGGPAG
jgi:HPt (histidine-containing phosphotransfer) domain-containing protein